MDKVLFDGESEDDILPGRGRSGATDIISALRLNDGKLANREQQVADYVKDHLDDVTHMTIAELADACDVSSPTVIRFCRSLGCDGFREFKLQLAQNLAVSLQYLDADLTNPPTDTSTAIDQVLSALYATANIMRKQVDAGALDAAKLAIMEARQLIVAGIGGGSSMLADEAVNRFFRLGISASAISDSYVLQMRAATLGPQDVLLLFSASGEADAIVGAAKIASGYGATTISISKPNTRLSDLATIAIEIDLPEGKNIFKPTASRYANLAILDALATAVAHERPEITTENLRRIRASLTAYHGRTGPQPLGD